MAGNYPNAPSWRMAHDRDGTQWFHMNASNVITALSSANAIALNDEASTSETSSPAASTTHYFIAIFPELRDLDAFFVARGATAAAGYAVQVSTNTTNGLDGTWTSISTASFPTTVIPNYRTGIVSSTQLGIRGVRFQLTVGASTNMALSTVHLYGEPVAGANPNRLTLWHPTLDQRVDPAYFDWGNTPRSSSADRTLRVKNLSSTLTANNVRVAMEALTDGTPSVPGQHSVSFGGGSFLAQVIVGDLAPGAISGVVTLRRITASNAQLGLFAMRVFAEAGTWS